jgi:glucose/arabinose dehydrogenase
MRLHLPACSFTLLVTVTAAAAVSVGSLTRAQSAMPTVEDPNLAVRTVVAGLDQPTAMAFLGDDDFLILEKATGKVKRVTDGAVVATVLDLDVNSFSERGLLGIALHPRFPAEPLVYLYWSESNTGADSAAGATVDLLGNRIDRFRWDDDTNTLTFDAPVIALRAFQADPGQPIRGNHDGGMLRFGPDGKLYIFIGDVGRRGWMQNLPCGPTASCPGPAVPDDQFGGPEPDDAHLTGVVLRLNPDGSTPGDNPFVANGIGGEAGDNIRKVFAYGFRNSFGMDFDPISGDLWLEQNGDDSFTELHRVTAGLNGGWIQIMGPVDRIAQFKAIETNPDFEGLQQLRWPPQNIAGSPAEALDRLFMLPGAHYADPEFSWTFEVAPAGLGFLDSRALGPQYNGDLFLGAARPTLLGGHLFRFNLTGNRRKIAVDDPRLEDRVADNLAKFDITESETLLFGRNFGVGTDIHTGPDGNLYVVSLLSGAVYVIHRAR